MATRQPRKLTLSEIKKILEPFNRPLSYDSATRKMTGFASTGGTKDIKDSNRRQLIDFLTEELSDVKIVPDPRALEELSEKLVERYNRSLIHTGTPVGMLAGESISGPITQIALSSFHFAGSAKNVGSSIDIIKEILNVSPNRKHFFTELHYNQPMTFMEVYNSRIFITGVTLNDIVVSATTTSIYDYVESIPDWVADSELLYGGDLDMTPFSPEIATDDEGKIIPPTLRESVLAGYPMYMTGSDWMVRIKLNQTAMYMNRIRMSDVVNVLVNAGPNLKIVQSPINVGEILVFVDEYEITESSSIVETRTREKFVEKEFEKDIVYKSFLWFNIAFIPSFPLIYVKGVKGMGNITPQEKPILSFVQEEYKATSLYNDDPNKLITPTISAREDIGSLYIVMINKYKMSLCGITKQRYIELAQQLGIEVVSSLFENRPDIIVVKTNDTIGSDSTPLSYMREQVAKYKMALDNFERTYRTTVSDKDTDFFSELSLPNDYERIDTISRLSHYVYADAEGTNLNEILKIDVINSDITICNNFHEFNAKLGIEATRNLLIKELVDTIIPQEYVDQRHIILLADYMTNKGIMTPITFLGLSQHQQGVSAQATMEKAVAVYKTASAFGAVESINTVSSSIQYGQRVTLGTGFNIDMINEKDVNLEDVKTKINVGSVDLSSLKEALNSSSLIVDNNAVKKLDSKNINPIQPKWEYSYRKQSDEGGDSVGTTQFVETTLPTLGSILPSPVGIIVPNPVAGNLKLDVASKMIPVMERLRITIPTEVNPIKVSVVIPSFVALQADIPPILRSVIAPRGSVPLAKVGDVDSLSLATTSRLEDVGKIKATLSVRPILPSSVNNNVNVSNNVVATPSAYVDPSQTKAPIVRRIVSLPKAGSSITPTVKPTIGKLVAIQEKLEEKPKEEIQTERSSNDNSNEFVGVTTVPSRIPLGGIREEPFSSATQRVTAFRPLPYIDTSNFI